MIVHVTPSYPPRLGGLEKVVQMLARTQHANGQNVAVITSDQGVAKNDVMPEPFSVTRLRSFIVANTAVMPGLLKSLLRVTTSDVIHLHITQALTPEVVWIYSKIRRVRYIAHVHLDIPPSGAAGFLLRIYKPVFLRKVLKDAAYVVVFTNDQKVEMHQNYGIPYERISVIPNGVDESFYHRTNRSIHKTPRLLFVGRLSYQKNLPQLLQALEGISDQFVTTIVGDGELRDELAQMSRALALQNVHFVGRAEGEALKSYYADADIFILPSEREGMPLVLLEAMAMALPVVATNVTGNRDVVDNDRNGILVPYDDPISLQTVLLQIKSDKKYYKRLSKNAFLSATEYSWDKVAQQCNTLYGVQA